MKKSGKKNPNDTTFRNLNALKKRVAKLEADTSWETGVMRQMIEFVDEVARLNKRLDLLMDPRNRKADGGGVRRMGRG